MTTWKDGGDYGNLKREIVSEGRSVCQVWTKRYTSRSTTNMETEPRPQGEANFRLILQAPQMLEALEAIWNKAEQALLDGGMTADRWADWEAVRGNALAAIAAVKGESNELA